MKISTRFMSNQKKGGHRCCYQKQKYKHDINLIQQQEGGSDSDNKFGCVVGLVHNLCLVGTRTVLWPG